MISDIDGLSSTKKDVLPDRSNTTEVSYPGNKTVVDLIEERALESPDAIAVSFRGDNTSYDVLINRANQLAVHLVREGIGKGDIVPISINRSSDLVIALLAILKTGAAFAPIDPNHFHLRIGHMLSDFEAKLIVLDTFAQNNIRRATAACPMLNVQNFVYEDSQVRFVNMDVRMSDPVYVLYTSGTTGKPKGVVIPHRGLTNLCCWHCEAFSVSMDSRSTVLSGVGFDALVWEIFPYLVAGGSLFPLTEEQRFNVDSIAEFYINNRISHSYLPVVLVHELLTSNIKINKTTILTGGERLSISSGIGDLALYNNYGPTECTVVSTVHQVKDTDLGNIPIGLPITNTEIFIVDDDNNLVSTGVDGQLCVSGPGVALGYLNSPKLSNEYFVDNPHKPGSKMYRTGDRACWRADGTIEFIGRNDDQVKIRGHRVELGEVEAQVTTHEDVTQCLVTARGNGLEKALECFYTSSTELSTKAVRSHLTELLPSYMIPTYYANVEKFPLNSNGKIDHDALPEAKLDLEPTHQITPGSTENRMITIWSELLQLDPRQLNVNQNFFELGGHSLKAIKLSNRIKKEFNIDVPIIEIFRLRTIRRLSEFVVTATQTTGGSGEDNQVTITI